MYAFMKLIESLTYLVKDLSHGRSIGVLVIAGIFVVLALLRFSHSRKTRSFRRMAMVIMRTISLGRFIK